MIQQSSFAQSGKIDSLQNVIKTTKDDSIKIHSLNKLSYAFLSQSSYSDAYATAQRALYLAQAAKNKIEISSAYWNIANIYCYQGDYSRSLDYYFKCLQMNQEIGKEFPSDFKKQKEIARSYNEIGYIYDYLSNYPKALEYYFKCMSFSEKIGYEEGQAIAYTNAAGVFDYQKNYDKAFEYDFKAAELDKKLNRKPGLAIVYNNIGNLYFKNKKYPEALDYQQKSLKIKNELGDELQIAASLNNIGNIYEGITALSEDSIELLFPSLKLLHGKAKESLLDSANYYFQASLDISIKEKSDYGIMLGYIGLGSFNFDKNKLNEALTYYDKAAAIGTKIKTQKELFETYGKMADICNRLGKYKEAYQNQKLYSDLKDTVFNETREKDLGGQEARFEYDKQLLSTQKEQEKKDALNAEEKRRQKLIITVAFAGLGLVIVFALFILKSYRQKQKANELISHQKLLVEVKQKEIIDSIHYAKRIQQSLLPTEKYIDKNLNRLKKKKE
jgi:tetratricopeptide (TPR) repeat protein